MRINTETHLLRNDLNTEGVSRLRRILKLRRIRKLKFILNYFIDYNKIMSESKYVLRTRKTRAKKLSNLTDEIMTNDKSISRINAKKKAEDKIRKVASQQRQALRLKEKGAIIRPKSNLNPLSTDEIKKIKGPLPVESKNILSDDKKLFDSLTYTEQKLINRMNKNRKTKTSMRSLVQYIKKVKQIYKKDRKIFNGSNIALLLNEKKTLEILKFYKNPKDHIWAVINILRSFPETEKDVNIYESEMGKYLKKNKVEIKENKKTEKQQKNWISHNKVITLFNKNKSLLTDKDELLMKFVIYFPRRLQDYYKMKLHKSGKKDFNYNYLNINKYGLPSSFQFFRSKSQNYEDVTKKIPTKLYNTIMNYVRDKKIKNNDLLFSKRNGKIHSADSFSKHIRKLFEVITDKDITSNTWRHIYETHFQDKNYSLNYREEIAKNAGHSLKTALEYVKK